MTTYNTIFIVALLFAGVFAAKPSSTSTSCALAYTKPCSNGLNECVDWGTGSCSPKCCEAPIERFAAYDGYCESQSRSTIEYATPTVASGATTFCFTLTICGPPALSHMIVGLPSCLGSTATAISGGGAWTNKDPTTGMAGIKWQEQAEGTSKEYCYTVTGDHSSYFGQLGYNNVAFKAGNIYGLSQIQGPTDCNPVQPPPPAPSPPPPPPVNTNNFCFNDIEYATLDNAEVNGLVQHSANSQQGCLALPAGWTIAANDGNTRVAMMGADNDFGTHFVVVVDGSALSVTDGSVLGSGPYLDSSCAAGTYGVSGAYNLRILISRAGSCPQSPCVVTKPIVHNSVSYSTVDCKCPCAKTQSCQDFPAMVPAGWAIVPAWTAEVAAALSDVSFGVQCMVTGDGASHSMADGSECFASGQLVNNSPFYAVASCDQRILVSKDGSETVVSDNVNAAVTPVNKFTSSGVEFALLDGTDPDSTAIGCQEEYYALPTGWSRAANTPSNRAVLITKQWGTACVVFADGVAMNNLLEPCGVDQLETIDHTFGSSAPVPVFRVKECNKRILITKGTPTGANNRIVAGGWNSESQCVTAGSVESVEQVLVFDPPYAGTAIYAAAVATVSTAVDGEVDPSFSLYMDVQFADGSWLYTQTINFEHSVGAHDQDGLFPLFSRGSVSRIVVTLLLRGHAAGAACFTNINVQVLNINPCGLGHGASSFGDPHLITLDGYVFDFMGVGEFWLTTDGTLNVQSRHAPAGQAAVTSAFAVQYGATRISIIRSNDDATPGARLPTLYINGRKMVDVGGPFAVFSIADGTFVRSGVFSGTGTSSDAYDGEVKYTITFPATGHAIAITAYISKFGVGFMRAAVTMPPSSMGLTSGLLGNYNGHWTDDLRDSTGKMYPSVDTTHSDLYDIVASGWRIAQSESLFDYPAGESTVDYTDTTFFNTAPAPIDMTTPAAEAAMATCGSQGLTNQLYELCVYDVILAGDASYAQGFQSTQKDLGIAVFQTTTIVVQEVPPVKATWVEENQTGLILGIVGAVLAVTAIIGVAAFMVLNSRGTSGGSAKKASGAI